MGFTLTLLYVVLNQLSLVDIVPELAPYHVFQWMVLAAGLASVPVILRGMPEFRAPQTYWMLGLIISIGASRAAHWWLGGIIPGVVDFLASAIVFFLVLANCTSLTRIRILMVAVTIAILYLLCRSVLAYHTDRGGADDDSPWLIYQPIATDGNVLEDPDASVLARIRAQGLSRDPNDFAQLLLISLPLIGLAWKAGHWMRNSLFVLAPACFILYGVYLTHSRGAFVGLAVMLAFALRHRFGTVRSLVGAVGLVALVITMVGNTRDVTLNDSSAGGRIMAWGAGISMLESSPAFGVGYNAFTEHSDETAHNSFVLCFAELGLFGYFFWTGLIASTLVELNRTIGSIDASGDNRELRRCAEAVRLSLFAFLATSWFLSRTYTITLYLLLGMAVVLARLANTRESRDSVATGQPWRLTLACQAASIVAVYVMIRLRTS